MTTKNKLSKSLSFVLRHGLEKEGIAHSNGWTNISEVLNYLNNKPRNLNVSEDDVRNLINEDDRNRLTILEDGSIRANYGHSFQVDIEKIEANPPKFLYFMTKKNCVDSILENGFENRNKIHQYLFESKEKAISGKEQVEGLSLVGIDVKKANIQLHKTPADIWITNEIIPSVALSLVSIENKQKQDSKRRPKP